MLHVSVLLFSFATGAAAHLSVNVLLTSLRISTHIYLLIFLILLQFQSSLPLTLLKTNIQKFKLQNQLSGLFMDFSDDDPMTEILPSYANHES